MQEVIYYVKTQRGETGHRSYSAAIAQYSHMKKTETIVHLIKQIRIRMK